MSPKDKYIPSEDQQDDDSSGGQSGQIEFVEFISSKDRLRDDQLPPEEKRRKAAEHEAINKELVKKQKAARAEKEAARTNQNVNQPVNAQGLRGGGGGEHSIYKQNPLLDCAQFQGATDTKVNPSPAQNNDNTNDKQRAEAELQYRLQNQPRYTPQPGFNPKPHHP